MAIFLSSATQLQAVDKPRRNICPIRQISTEQKLESIRIVRLLLQDSNDCNFEFGRALRSLKTVLVEEQDAAEVKKMRQRPVTAFFSPFSPCYILRFIIFHAPNLSTISTCRFFVFTIGTESVDRFLIMYHRISGSKGSDWRGSAVLISVQVIL